MRSAALRERAALLTLIDATLRHTLTMLRLSATMLPMLIIA